MYFKAICLFFSFVNNRAKQACICVVFKLLITKKNDKNIFSLTSTEIALVLCFNQNITDLVISGSNAIHNVDIMAYCMLRDTT